MSLASALINWLDRCEAAREGDCEIGETNLSQCQGTLATAPGA